MNLYHTALITGASSGIGESFAKQLASQGMDLILVARSEEKLQELADELRIQHQVKVDVIPADLTEPSAVDRVFQKTEQLGREVDLLINNAGVGIGGKLLKNGRSKVHDMIQLNVTALVELTQLYLPGMLQRGGGAIINISSIAGLAPIPNMAAYGATKAFVLQFSQALWAEYHKQGIHVLAVCPGPTSTSFFQAAGMDGIKGVMRMPDHVAKSALRALRRKKLVVVDGFANRLRILFLYFLPKKFILKMVEKMT